MQQVSKIYFVTKLYMFRASSVPIIRSNQLYTWQLVCFMQVMWPLPRTVRLEPGKPKGKRLLGRPTYKWEDKINLVIQDVGWGGMD
jgi:hypothetical protein